MPSFDVIVIGAGAAGLMCAIEAGKRGRNVAVLEHQKQPGRKILMSGGGRCNFTNLDVSSANFFSANPHFCKSALARYTPRDFIDLVKKHGIPFHEKKLGQLFCDGSSREIVSMLRTECEQAGVSISLNVHIVSVTKAGRFKLQTSAGEYSADSLVIATGGLSIPKAGATDFGHKIAGQFGLNVTPTAPALDGFVFPEDMRRTFSPLAGVSHGASITAGGRTFRENILFTHSGLSGPAALQASLYWTPAASVVVDLSPDTPVADWLTERKRQGLKSDVRNLLGTLLPGRLAEIFGSPTVDAPGPVDRMPDAALRRIGDRINRWEWVPSGTVGYAKAEVTKGGVDTNELSSQTMESKKVKGLFFIGEVVDVTGWLGGYNFQWAWSSGWAAGQAV